MSYKTRPGKHVKLNLPITCQFHLSVMLECLILKIVLFRCIYRKPTTTDTTINFTSKHPMEHKISTYRYLINRMTSLPLTTERRKIEWQNILAIAQNNNCPSIP
jgi:hypothetical protein